MGRNTAPCIAAGAALIRTKYEDALMMVLPSDHLIRYNGMFQTTLKEACEVAEKGDNLVTIGITPDHPETGYGYIRFAGESALSRNRRWKRRRNILRAMTIFGIPECLSGRSLP